MADASRPRVIKRLFNPRNGTWVGITDCYILGGIVRAGPPPVGVGPMVIVNGTSRQIPPQYLDNLLDPDEYPAIKVLYGNKGHYG